MKTIAYADLTPDDAGGVKFWGALHDERLTHDDLDEALRDHLEPWLPTAIQTAGELVMHGFVPMALPKPEGDAEWVLELLLERWDEDLGDWEGEPTKPSEGMRAAALVFVQTVQKEYRVFACEPILAVRVPVLDWVKANEPEWLDASD